MSSNRFTINCLQKSQRENDLTFMLSNLIIGKSNKTKVVSLHFTTPCISLTLYIGKWLSQLCLGKHWLSRKEKADSTCKHQASLFLYSICRVSLSLFLKGGGGMPPPLRGLLCMSASKKKKIGYCHVKIKVDRLMYPEPWNIIDYSSKFLYKWHIQAIPSISVSKI